LNYNGTLLEPSEAYDRQDQTYIYYFSVGCRHLW